MPGALRDRSESRDGARGGGGSATRIVMVVGVCVCAVLSVAYVLAAYTGHSAKTQTRLDAYHLAAAPDTAPDTASDALHASDLDSDAALTLEQLRRQLTTAHREVDMVTKALAEKSSELEVLLAQHQRGEDCDSRAEKRGPDPPVAREEVKAVASVWKSAPGDAWLCIGIPSAPRKKDYLNPTIDYILEQLPAEPSHPLFGKVVLLIVNNGHGRPHEAFDRAKERFAPGAHAKSVYFKFVVNSEAKEEGTDSGNPNRPGVRVRQQTRDVIHMLEEAKSVASYFMFMEDDFRLCPHALTAIQYLISKAARVYPDWALLRVCYGLNGAIIRKEDLQELANYYRLRYKARPPDHLVVEWSCQETDKARKYLQGRPHVTFRHNLFEHIGQVSSLRSQSSPVYAGCYEPLVDGVLFEVEGFRMAQCGHDDIQPCPALDSPTYEPPIRLSHLEGLVKRVGQPDTRRRPRPKSEPGG